MPIWHKGNNINSFYAGIVYCLYCALIHTFAHSEVIMSLALRSRAPFVLSRLQVPVQVALYAALFWLHNGLWLDSTFLFLPISWVC